VRELENAIEHAVTVSEGRRIRAEDLPTAIRVPKLLRAGVGATPAAGAAFRALPGGSAAPPGEERARDAWSLADVEKEHIQRVLTLHRGNATTAARQLGISRTTLWRKLREYGLTRKGT
jgi:transcriptional regulator of acetoin/glycerol metabolism